VSRFLKPLTAIRDAMAATNTVADDRRPDWTVNLLRLVQKVRQARSGTRASDGTEIWNYVNGRNISTCNRGGTLFGTTVDMATYSGFSNCMSTAAACNNIFYIKNGIV
jgi:hypothetical protein